MALTDLTSQTDPSQNVGVAGGYMAQRPAQGFIEGFVGGYDETTNANSSLSYENNYRDLYNQQSSVAKSLGYNMPSLDRSGSQSLTDIVTGSPFYNSKTYSAIHDGTADEDTQKAIAEYDKTVAEVNLKHPEAKLLSSKQIDEQVKIQAQQAEQRYDTSKNNIFGTVGGVLGNIAGSLNPYVNPGWTAPLNFVGGFGKNVATRVAANALAGGVSAGAEDIFGGNEDRKRLGLPEHDIGTDVVEGAVSGAVLQGGIDLLAKAASSARNPMSKLANENKNKPLPPTLDNTVPTPDNTEMQALYKTKPFGDTPLAESRVNEDYASTSAQVDAFGGPDLHDIQDILLKDNVRYEDQRAAITNDTDADNAARQIDPIPVNQYLDAQDKLAFIDHTESNLNEDARSLREVDDASITKARETIAKNNEEIKALTTKVDDLKEKVISTEEASPQEPNQQPVEQGNAEATPTEEPTTPTNSEGVPESKVSTKGLTKEEKARVKELQKENKKLKDTADQKTRSEINPDINSKLEALDAYREHYNNVLKENKGLYDRAVKKAKNIRPNENLKPEPLHDEATDVNASPNEKIDSIPDEHSKSTITDKGLEVHVPTLDERYNITKHNDGHETVKVGDSDVDLKGGIHIEENGEGKTISVKDLLEQLNELSALANGAFKKACDFCAR